MKILLLIFLICFTLFGCSAKPEQIFPAKELDEISFLWTRAFDEAVHFKIENKKNKVSLYIRVFNGIGIGHPVREESVKELNKKDFLELEEQLTSLRMISEAMNKESKGADGSDWTLEGVKGEFRFSVSAWSPLRERIDGSVNPVGTLGKRIIKLSGLDIDEGKIY